MVFRSLQVPTRTFHLLMAVSGSHCEFKHLSRNVIKQEDDILCKLIMSNMMLKNVESY